MKPARKIIIVPHDVINYLPFEMLNDESGNLLLEKFSFSYAASESLRQEQNSMAVDGNFFAGFQADYSNQSDFPQLNGSFNEVNSIGDLLGFRSSKFSAATADDFRKQAPNFKVIHLALHSQINDEKPLFSRLIFTRNGDDPNSDITANELYGMHLNAEIAVLSACETGLGKLHRGEGMMSLSRAFMYAGVPSTLMSLWKVPDQTTSILMTNFYRSLKEGLPRDEALRMAKLNLIENHPEMAHPFFWAGFIVNGKTEPMEISNFSFLEVFAISVFVSSLIVYLVVRTIRRKKLLKRV